MGITAWPLPIWELETALSLLMTRRVWDAFPWPSKCSIARPVPLSPHLGSTVFFALYIPASCAFLPQGLCTSCILGLAFSASSLSHLLPHFPVPTHPLGPRWGFPSLGESVLAALGKWASSRPHPSDPCCLPAGSNYMDSGMSVQLISVPTPTPKVSWSLLPAELLVKPFSVGPKKQTRSAQPCFLPGSRAQHFLPNLPSLLPVGSRMEWGSRVGQGGNRLRRAFSAWSPSTGGCVGTLLTQGQQLPSALSAAPPPPAHTLRGVCFVNEGLAVYLHQPPSPQICGRVLPPRLRLELPGLQGASLPGQLSSLP